MSFYFFHLRDGVDLLLDEEGREFDRLDEIVAAALRDARSIVCDEVMPGRVDLDKHLDVEDADGRLVHRLAFVDAAEFVEPPPVGAPGA